MRIEIVHSSTYFSQLPALDHTAGHRKISTTGRLLKEMTQYLPAYGPQPLLSKREKPQQAVKQLWMKQNIKPNIVNWWHIYSRMSNSHGWEVLNWEEPGTCSFGAREFSLLRISHWLLCVRWVKMTGEVRPRTKGNERVMKQHSNFAEWFGKKKN